MAKEWKKVPVEEFTSPTPVTVNKDTPINEIKALMRENGIRHIPVVDGTTPIGIISDRDVKLASNFCDAKTLKAEEIMTPEPYTVTPEALLDDVAFEMSKNKYGCAIVQDTEGEVVGVFTSTDALNALIEILRGDI